MNISQKKNFLTDKISLCLSFQKFRKIPWIFFFTIKLVIKDSQKYLEKVCCDIQIILLQRSTKNQKTKQKTTISSELLRNLYFLSNAYLMDRRTPVNKADVILVNTLRIPANFKDYVNLQIISTIPCNNQEPHIKLKMRFIFLNPRRGDVKYGGV